MAPLPLSLLAADPLDDRNPGSVHNANIQALANAGITKGCDPRVSYCPNGPVAREGMASFRARTAGLGTGPPVANAKTVQIADTATCAQAVPDGAITPSPLAAGGAPAGLVLTATGTGVAFQALPVAPSFGDSASGSGADIAPCSLPAIAALTLTTTEDARHFVTAEGLLLDGANASSVKFIVDLYAQGTTVPLASVSALNNFSDSYHYPIASGILRATAGAGKLCGRRGAPRPGVVPRRRSVRSA